MFPRFDATVGEPVVEPLSGVDLINRLAPEIRSSQARMFGWLGSFTREVRACVVRYRSPHQMPAMLAKLLEES